jgi:hypothetical protein
MMHTPETSMSPPMTFQHCRPLACELFYLFFSYDHILVPERNVCKLSVSGTCPSSLETAIA